MLQEGDLVLYTTAANRYMFEVEKLVGRFVIPLKGSVVSYEGLFNKMTPVDFLEPVAIECVVKIIADIAIDRYNQSKGV